MADYDLFKIPLTAEPQTFTIKLSAKDYQMTVRWNPEDNAWNIDIAVADTLQPLIMGLPMVTGANLLEQFGHLGIKGSLYAYTDGNQFAPPTLENLGNQAQLYYVTTKI